MSYFREDMKHTLWVRRFVRMVDHGRRPEYGAPEKHPCRWEPGARLVKTAEGRQQACEGTLFTTAHLGPKDVFWVPGTDKDDFGASRVCLSAFKRYDLETGGYDHTEVLV